MVSYRLSETFVRVNHDKTNINYTKGDSPSMICLFPCLPLTMNLISKFLNLFIIIYYPSAIDISVINLSFTKFVI